MSSVLRPHGSMSQVLCWHIHLKTPTHRHADSQTQTDTDTDTDTDTATGTDTDTDTPEDTSDFVEEHLARGLDAWIRLAYIRFDSIK